MRASILARLLAERGIKVAGNVRANHEPDHVGCWRVRCWPNINRFAVGDTVKLVNKISQNLHTEVLLRTAARQQGPWATPEELPKFPSAFYAKVGLRPDDVMQTDGSGLSRHDMVTPRAFVALLRVRAEATVVSPYYFSLPVPGVDGTLDRTDEKRGNHGKNSREDGIRRARAGTVRLCGNAQDGRRVFFFPEQ